MVNNKGTDLRIDQLPHMGATRAFSLGLNKEIQNPLNLSFRSFYKTLFLIWRYI